ncbi:MOSC domain-containing protein [Novosphingobium sp. ST904]|uniref:MOSC domain-containing protein n=1 Tax=Novosphingobium sp. ST904 TaxID=1684385 RepID=UPI0006C8C0E0|nr:MOSC domain-containing protein [Novosphingobium sp. ST904]KPH60612.1 molybdenum cofactor biosysynthesis protein [Novosphingobium sp. ST904]TCM39388.1 MOSC domain-containing protein YiiM [Novosphingobium sp. ST904]
MLTSSLAAESFAILSVQRGKVQPFRGPEEPSAIGKVPADGAVKVHRLGLEGDEQADLSVHGGPDKAIHHYPHDHYAFWRDSIGAHPLLSDFGAFGENIATEGLTEDMICVGDRWRLGTALVEVSQGRQPCWKLDHRFDGAPVNAGVVRSRRAGWYYRVLEEGEVAAGDRMVLEERPWPEWTVRRVFGLLIAGDHKKDRESLEALGEVATLATPWIRRRAKLLGLDA